MMRNGVPLAESTSGSTLGAPSVSLEGGRFLPPSWITRSHTEGISDCSGNDQTGMALTSSVTTAPNSVRSARVER